MVRQITSLAGRLGSTIRAFSIAQRTIALIGVAVLILGIASLTMWVTTPSYTPLFSGLQAADANTIVEQLRTDGVPYQLTGGGGTIMVPEEHVYDERLKAAAAGLPSSSTGGYSLLDKMGVTSSEFQQSVTYKRAMEGELAATIAALKGVKTASVHLAIPEKTVFVSKETSPTASVFVETANGITLTPEQVQAIVHLTSASIDGMKPSDVAVVDADGTVLSAVGVGATGSTDTQASDYEGRVRNAVQSMLDRVVGPGNATVVVAADMNYESAQRVEESFSNPGDTPALNESTSTETSSGSGQTAAGVLGPDNIAVPSGSAPDAGSFSSESATRNNAVNKVTESRTIPAGALNRQTVSVALNAKVAGKLDIDKVTDLVAAAAGINADRGDTATVKIVSFNDAGAAEATAALNASKQAAADALMGDLLRTGIITVGIVLLAALGFIFFARRSRRQDREPIDIGALDEAVAPRLSVSLPPAPVHDTSFELTPPLQPDSGRVDIDRKRADIDALAATDPERTAQFLRGLMDDRQPA